jgi:hypothetical protein
VPGVEIKKPLSENVDQLDMSQAGEGDSDELTRRFKALFNKEPLSQAPKDESPWRLQGQDDYEIDDEEVVVI